jgi:hypothetical protein
MPDERAASEAARRKKAADRKGKAPATAKPAQARPATTRPASTRPVAAQPARALLPAESIRKPAWLRILGWITFAVALALFVVFVVLWVRGDISRAQQLYPLPGLATGFLIIGIWTALGPWLYRSRSTAARAGKYVLAGVITIGIYPAAVTLVGALAEYIVSLFPGSPLH